MSDQRVPIPGSEVKPGIGERWSPNVPSSETLIATLMLRRHTGSSAPSEEELLSGRYEAPSRSQAAAALAADPADIAAVHSFAHEYGLAIVEEKPEARRIQVRGTVAQMEKAFGVHFQLAAASDGRSYLTYSGSISVPKALAGIVTAVLGLDQRPIAKHHAQ